MTTAVWTFSTLPALAQRAPDAGSILRDQAQPVLPAPELTQPQAPLEAPRAARQGPSVMVRAFHIRATLFPESELLALLSDYVGRPATLGDLDEAALRISRFYREHDYSARAYLPPQTIADGIVEIDVLEATLGAVKTDPTSPSRLDPDLAAGLVAGRAVPGSALRPGELEEGVAILNEVPGVGATAVLRPGSSAGESVADLRLTDRPLVAGFVQLDDEGVHATGERRALASLTLDDSLGRGERFAAMAMKTSGSTYGRLAVQMPVGGSGLTLGVDGTELTYSLEGPFSALDEGGYAYSAGLVATYPVRRTPGFSLSAYATLDYKRLVAWAVGTDTSDRAIEVGTAGLSATLSDRLLGGGVDTLGASVTIGNLDRGADREDLAADAATARSNGLYGKLSLNAARLQPLNDKLSLSLSAAGQIAQKNLDSSEQFSLGGPNGVRAYPVNEADGDDGAVGTAELRLAALDGIRLSGFYDIGIVRQHVTPYAGWQPVAGQPDSYCLQGAGLGLDWTVIEGGALKATVARAIGANAGHDAQGDNSTGKRGKTALWLQAALAF